MKQKNLKLSVTNVLIGLNVFIFILTLLYDLGSKNNGNLSGISIETLLLFGAKYNFYIVEGQYWRLVSTMFLHANLFHIIFNMGALRVLGRDLEYLFGPKKFFLLYMLCGILGSIGSFIFNTAVGVGASGAIFGLLGAHIYLFFKNKEVYRQIYGKDIFVMIGINIVIGFLSPNIDNSAHISGLIAGFIVASALGLAQEKIWHKKRILFQGLTIALIVSFFVFAKPRYMESADYAFDKSIDLILSQDLEKATSYLEQNVAHFPEDDRLKRLLTQIKPY